MKRYILEAAMLLSVAAALASEPAQADTVAVNPSEIEGLVCDTTVNTKGKTVIKYYLMVNRELISTTKTVADKMRLCRKYGADCALAKVTNRKTRRKRIILN